MLDRDIQDVIGVSGNRNSKSSWRSGFFLVNANKQSEDLRRSLFSGSLMAMKATRDVYIIFKQVEIILEVRGGWLSESKATSGTCPGTHRSRVVSI